MAAIITCTNEHRLLVSLGAPDTSFRCWRGRSHMRKGAQEEFPHHADVCFDLLVESRLDVAIGSSYDSGGPASKVTLSTRCVVC